MSSLAKATLVPILLFVQLLIFPSSCGIRPTSEVWTWLLVGSFSTFVFLTACLLVFSNDVDLRRVWRFSFLLYLGTLGSPLFNAPDITLLLLVFSWPTLVVRRLLRASRQPGTDG